MPRYHTTKIPAKIKKLLRKHHLEIMILSDEDARTTLPDNCIAMSIGAGVILVRKTTQFKPIDMNLILLHEIGHSVLNTYPLKVSEKTSEIEADSIALYLAFELKLPVSLTMLRRFSNFTKSRNRNTHE